MRRHRRPTALTSAVALLAIAAAAGAVVVPASAGAVHPSANELLVGWVLLGVGVMLTARAPILAIELSSAGTMWVAVGLAPYAPDALGSSLQRLALTPTALVTIAAISLPRGRPTSRVATSAAVAAAGVAAVAGSGWYRWAVAALGLLALGTAAASHRAVRPRRTTNTQLAIGAALLASGVLAAESGSARPTFVASIHEFVLVGAAAGIGWCAARGSQIAVGGLIDLAHPGALGTALGAALGTRPLDIVFPVGDHRWLDSSGQFVPALVGGIGVSAVGTGQFGPPIAYVSPPLTLDGADADDVRRLLTAAADAARLRAALREQADEISRSRARLEFAADGERARLAMLIEAGPLATLARADEFLKSTESGRALDARLAAPRSTLCDVVGGLDTIAAAGGLTPALQHLAERWSASATIADAADLGTDEARAVWFVCAEALANAAKHAPGVRVSIRLDRLESAYELCVSDAGPGGADARGGGLAGLRERAMSVGGTLTLESSSASGTYVHLVVPVRDARFHVADRVATPIHDEADRLKVTT